MGNSLEIGSKEWFKKRAESALKRAERPGVWDFSDSALIWSPDAEKFYKNLQEDDTQYKSIVTDVESDFLKKIAPSIIESLPRAFSFIDLGPGTEHKERFFLAEIKKQNKEMVYIPVDVNLAMLNIAVTFAKQHGFHVHPIHQTFEELPKDLMDISKSFKFASLGLTFTNYDPTRGLDILKNIIDYNGAAFITSQLRDRIDIEVTRRTYASETVQRLLLPKLRLLGLGEDNIEDVEVTDDIFVYHVLKNIPDNLRRVGMKEGDKVLALKSYRYTHEELKKIIEPNFNAQYYDIGSEFLGVRISIKRVVDVKSHPSRI